MTSIRVLVVEDDVEFATSFCAQIAADSRFSLPHHAISIAAARVQLARNEYDVLAIDLSLSDGSGIELIADAKIGGKKIVVSIFGDVKSVVEAIAAGANGYVLKDDIHLVAALFDIFEGHSPLSAPVAAHVLRRVRELSPKPANDSATRAQLSPREIETLNALAMGLTYQETAKRLGISPHTASDHVKSIYRKLAVNSSAAAVYAGIDAGIISLSRSQ